ncbi:hypothetical protein XU18_1841 [Perkinsela sp. CCAP 1560/4]|nr:hypothetical protein XU18_1841 [Perkinsela sp. CCAP 1560/4]|eukprot:KNH07309.1 hypothetical protein XU18_1841 [Perkinsela sp. CCAP 1560/4]
MSSHLFPGLFSHRVGPIPHRVFLGSKKEVEAHFLRHMQSVHPWLLNTPKARGAQGQEFYELDLNTNHDAEVLLRWCQIFYIRREMTEALLKKAGEYLHSKKLLEADDEKKVEKESRAFSAVEAGDPPSDRRGDEKSDKARAHKPDTPWPQRLPDAETTQSLRDILSALEEQRLPYERKRLQLALHGDGVSLYDTETPVAREIKTATARAFNKNSCAHMLAATRYVTEDVLRERHDVATAVDFERRAKYFLPRQRMEELIRGLGEKHLPSGLLYRPDSEPKTEKFIEKLFRCSEYRKLYAHASSMKNASQMRPFELRSLAKHCILHNTAVDTSIDHGEESAKTQWFAKCVWANFAMKIVSHPGWLVHNSNAWQWELPVVSENVKPLSHVASPEAPSDTPEKGPDDTPSAYRMPIGLAIACSTAPYVLPGSNIAAYISLSAPKHMINNTRIQAEWADWHDNMFALPLPRVVPFMGEAVAVDLLATLHVEKKWKKLDFPQSEQFRSEEAIAKLHEAHKEICSLSWDFVLKDAVAGVQTLYGDLTQAENRWMNACSP